MDLSKLPKLSGRESQSPARDPQEEIPVAALQHGAVNPIVDEPPPQGMFASPSGILISLVIAVIFLFLGMPFFNWLLATATGREFSTGIIWSPGTPAAGKPVGYWELQGGTAWTDCGMFLFGVSALIDAAVMFIALRSSNPGVRLAAMRFGFLVTALATIINALVCVKLFSLGILPLFSLLAVGLGGYILLEQKPVVFPRRSSSAHFR